MNVTAVSVLMKFNNVTWTVFTNFANQSGLPYAGLTNTTCIVDCDIIIFEFNNSMFIVLYEFYQLPTCSCFNGERKCVLIVSAKWKKNKQY